MKTKDIVLVVVSLAVITVSLYFTYILLFPAKNNEAVDSKAQSVPKVPTEIDETTYKTIETLSDYGKPALTGIGKPDLFGGF